ncbi:uncharacterized [Tachysurus ichikawai]
MHFVSSDESIVPYTSEYQLHLPSRWDAVGSQIKMVSFHLKVRHSAANRASNGEKREEEDESPRRHY